MKPRFFRLWSWRQRARRVRNEPTPASHEALASIARIAKIFIAEISGHALVAGRQVGAGGRRETLVEFHGSGDLRGLDGTQA